jgi:hypothetical protein
MVTDLRRVFQHEVLKMLKKAGKLNEVIIENVLSWHHSGFQIGHTSSFFVEDSSVKTKLSC